MSVDLHTPDLKGAFLKMFDSRPERSESGRLAKEFGKIRYLPAGTIFAILPGGAALFVRPVFFL